MAAEAAQPTMLRWRAARSFRLLKGTLGVEDALEFEGLTGLAGALLDSALGDVGFCFFSPNMHLESPLGFAGALEFEGILGVVGEPLVDSALVFNFALGVKLNAGFVGLDPASGFHNLVYFKPHPCNHTEHDSRYD